MSALGFLWCFEKLLLGFGTDIFVAGSKEHENGREGGREKRKGEGDDDVERSLKRKHDKRVISAKIYLPRPNILLREIGRAHV